MSSVPFSFNSLNGTQPPLVAGSGSATLLTTYSEAPFNPFNKTYERTPFTLEVWFRPLTNTGELTVIGHPTEGVIWNGTNFILRMRQTAGVAETTWTPGEKKSFHVVMVYTPGLAQLYVDAVLVASLDLPDSPFTATGLPVRINSGTGTGIYDSFATYVRALPGAEIAQHYVWAKAIRTPPEIASANGGSTWTMVHGDSDIYATVKFDSEAWAQFFLNGLGIVGDRLVANEGGGTWIGSVPIESMITGTLAGVSLNYEGFNVVLSYSTDASTWTPVANGTVIFEDISSTGLNLFLRIDLPEEGWVDSLSVSVLNDRALSPASGSRDLRYKGIILDHESVEPLDYTQSWGAEFGANASLVIPADTNTSPVDIGTVEMWVKFNALGSQITFLDGETTGGAGAGWINLDPSGGIGPGGGQVYINGVARSAGYVLSPNIWYHVTFVEATPGNITVFVGRPRQSPSSINMTVGHLAVYPQAMSASEVSSLYGCNVGSPRLRIDDTSGVAVTEQAAPVLIYARDWSYVSGGS